MKKISTEELKEKRQQLMDKINALECKILRGSVIESYKKCGKPGCKCEHGEGHGPKYSMTINFPKRRPENDYIRLEQITQVKEYVANYHRIRPTNYTVRRDFRSISVDPGFVGGGQPLCWLGNQE
jgi:hypothetical protein